MCNVGEIHIWVMLTWYLYMSIPIVFFPESWEHLWLSFTFSLHFVTSARTFFLFIPSHTLSLYWECSDLPAWPPPAWIITASFFLTNFYFLCSNSSAKTAFPSFHPSFLLAFPHPSDQGTVECFYPYLCSWISQFPWPLTLLCQQPWSCSPRRPFLPQMGRTISKEIVARWRLVSSPR